MAPTEKIWGLKTHRERSGRPKTPAEIHESGKRRTSHVSTRRCVSVSGCMVSSLPISPGFFCDEYANRIPNPKHMPKYTKAKVPLPKINMYQLCSFAELCCHCHNPIKSLAAPCLPEYVATHSQLTGYLRPKELDT